MSPSPFAINIFLSYFIRLLDLDTIPKSLDFLSGALWSSALVLSSHHPKLRRITCLLAPIPITKNCCEALSSLYHNFNNRTIWIDAICIKQTDDWEKSHYIQLMEISIELPRDCISGLERAT
jgi:hypothetical protein